MSDPFDSPEALLERADHHIADLQAAVSDFARERCGAPFAECDGPGISTRIKVKFSSGVPATISAIAFDIINELRSALDHAVYAAAIEITGIPEPANTKFPFGDDAESARKDFLRKRPPAGLERLCDACIAIQAYENGRNESLWRLNKLRNGKIHRLLTPFASVNSGALISRSGIALEAENLRTVSEWDGEKQELTFLTASKLETDKKIRPIIDVAFEQTSAFPSERAPKTLKNLTIAVRSAVNDIRDCATT